MHGALWCIFTRFRCLDERWAIWMQERRLGLGMASLYCLILSQPKHTLVSNVILREVTCMISLFSCPLLFFSFFLCLVSFFIKEGVQQPVR